ncbi:MAG: Sir2 silent information regulator family NAD-dependent deacetylase [Lachnospiraceae bacterium]|nr:Sir2 silent information regulator family NAD-dependent deacetylase [Lachnospiraceae bacterium]
MIRRKVLKTSDTPDGLNKLKEALNMAQAVIVGAGAGLSTSAGFVYTGERFDKYFGDFAEKYHFKDMYSGGFYPYDTLEEHWAYWSRYIYINRYMDAPKPVYHNLYELVKDKDYFVLTTNVDHCFQKAGFDKERLFYTQGDYGLFQCSVPCHHSVYDNGEVIKKMVEAQGYILAEDGTPYVPEKTELKMAIPAEMVPHCPVCHKPMTMNLRADNTFVEDDGWHKAAGRYSAFLEQHRKKRVLFLELGVGYNTPGIIKYPFWQMTAKNPKAIYACINYGEAVCPHEIEKRSICIDGDIGEILEKCVSE